MEPTQTLSSIPALAFIPARHYGRLLDVLVERGHCREAVLASVGLGHESFGRDAGYLSLGQMEALVKRACVLEPTAQCITVDRRDHRHAHIV